MIFAAVGTARDFGRLVKKVDEIAGKIKEEVIIQIGQTKYRPKNCKYFEFVPRDKFLDFVKKADVVITHAGVGTIINCLNYMKPTIVVPRRKKYNEHKNDHQMDIAKELEKESRIISCYDVDELGEKIERAKKFKPPDEKREKNKLEKILEGFIESLGIENENSIFG